MKMYERYRLKQDGQVVAGCDGYGPGAHQGILHYAAVYSQDGPVTIEHHNGKRWVKLGALHPAKAVEIRKVREDRGA